MHNAAAPIAPLDPLTGIQAARFAVYVHFPYCLSKCPYCDFASTAAPQIPQARYASAVLNELAARAAQWKGRSIDAVYFGGGTPSLWDARHVGEVLNALAAAAALPKTAEVTLEANPGAADAARFAEYRAAGINRLSIGVQSFQAEQLHALGREHSGTDAVAAFKAARAAGFRNVSLDFIYGVHGQTLQNVMADAVSAAALQPEHLSAYALTLDKEVLAEEVPLARQLSRGEVQLPPDDEVVAMQRAVSEVFAAAGLERYEVSNYARPGFHSRHNAAYWTGGEYLAVGSGATGRVGTTRYSNQRSADKWLHQLEAGRLAEVVSEPLSADQLLGERIAMGLRLVSGVDVLAAAKAHGVDVKERERSLKFFASQGLLTRVGGRAALTPKGFDLHSAIAARLM